jgi:hypothetical protein
MIGFTSPASAQPSGDKPERVPFGFVGTAERAEIIVSSQCPADDDSPSRWLMSSMDDFTRV